MLKMISWNVNGLRAVQKKGFEEIFKELDADFFCVQETKLQEGQIEIDFPSYTEYWNYAEKKGYSGTAIWAKKPALNVTYGMGKKEHDNEGRLITLEYEDFYFITCYTPNSKRDLTRLSYREEWEDDFRTYLSELKKKKPVIMCGDLNVAHENIDLKNWKTNQKNSGFTPEERAKFSELLAAGFIDTFRYKYPEVEGAYSWWSYQFNARKNNAGWRIDYFVVSEDIKDKIIDAKILPEIMGSDHCPVELDINFA
ncbi:MAG: exodeoxyribonuclease III [Lactobacillales bacterium]|jgi:exodeoxyribonuclease-3|nr:exodeoxyribonuclease III [Lactobacillales bacterium]